jgi:Tfp pilus assembly PilM family ATPase
MSENTKETNFFGIVDKWDRMKEMELDEEVRKEYKKKNSEFMNNLSRKIKVLFPHEDEFVQKIRIYLDYYLNGMKLEEEMWKSPYLMKN